MQLFSATCTSQARLDGKTTIITGCNSGIGKETARDFYKRGAKVIMACRDVKKAEEAKADIEKSMQNKMNLGKLIVKKLDLNSLASVKAFAESVLKEESQINILVNNAGVMICPKGKTEDGFETQFGTNHLAHFYLTLLLIPKIMNSTPARIVNVSSMAHRYGAIDLEDPNYVNKQYKEIEVYGQSKLANILFTRSLDTKFKENNIKGINTYSLHPGAILTGLSRHMDSYGFKGLECMYRTIGSCGLLKTPEQGAQTIIYCSLDEKCANESGLYYAECAVKKPTAAAEDDEMASKLWDLSTKLVKLEGYNPFSKTR